MASNWYMNRKNCANFPCEIHTTNYKILGPLTVFRITSSKSLTSLFVQDMNNGLNMWNSFLLHQVVFVIRADVSKYADRRGLDYLLEFYKLRTAFIPCGFERRKRLTT